MPPSDFRSDTVTRPTPHMREAMARATVGDDVYGEDPTVRALEEAVAGLLGREAGLFVPSGTMANQIGVRALATWGEELVAEARSHVVLYEGGGSAWISGVQIRTIETERGVFTAEQLAGAVRPDDIHCPRTSLVCVENTHNIAGGVPWRPEEVEAVADEARERGLKVLMDGARLLNACVATQTEPARYASSADLVWIALSKGLGAPVGSVMAGDRDLIERCRRIRKALGGGMRQAGILAAAGLVALENWRETLSEDHRRARALAEALAELDGATVDPESVETNIVFVTLEAPVAARVERELKRREVLALALDERRVRFVTHRDVGDEDVGRAASALAEALSEIREGG